MDSPLLTLVCPAHNEAGNIAQLLREWHAQFTGLGTPFELIVVDDGSTDDSADRLYEYGARIRVLRQVNRGVSAARNTGIRAAGGELIALLDSDDYWLPGKLAAQVHYFETHPEALICQTEEIWMRNGVRVNGKRVYGTVELVPGDELDVGARRLRLAVQSHPRKAIRASR